MEMLINSARDLRVVALVAIAILLGCPRDGRSQTEADRIAKLVQDSQRSGFEGHDFAGYMAIWSPDAKIVTARSSKPGTHDIVLTRGQIEERARLKLRGPASKDVKLEFASASVEILGDKAVLRYRSVLKTEDTVGTAAEEFRLRKAGGEWKVYENRYWPVETRVGEETTKYDAATWQQLDAAVERAQEAQDLRGWTIALLDAWRWKESHPIAKKLTDASSDDATAWILRGHAAILAGDAKDAEASFGQALKLDPQARVPDYIRASSTNRIRRPSESK